MFLPYGDERPREAGAPWVTWGLILVNILVALQLGLQIDQETALRYGFIPARPSLETACTAMFVHAGLLHLAGNLWFLWIFGDNVELRMGWFKYLLGYLLCGFGGTASHYLFFPQSPIPVVGASGAIFGVLGMYLFLFPANRVRCFYFFFLYVGTMGIRAVWVIGFWFAKEAILSYLAAQGQLQGGVGHLAHFGGFGVGMAVEWMLVGSGLVQGGGGTLWDWAMGRRPPPSQESVAQGPDVRLEQAGGAQGGALPAEGFYSATALGIARLIQLGHMDEARRLWRRSSFEDERLVLPPHQQLELAWYLDRRGERSGAQEACRRLLEFHPEAQPYAAEAHLTLAAMGLEALRSGDDPDLLVQTVGHLRRVMETHPDAKRRALAERWMGTLGAG